MHAWAARRVGAAEVVRFLALVSSLPIAVEQETPERMLKEIVALARASRLSTYRASHLDLAMRLGLPIATEDAPLAKSAKKARTPLFTQARPRRKPS